MGYLFLALLVLFVGGVAYARRRADMVITIAGGEVKLVRGKVPPTVLHDLLDVAQHAPEAEGRILINGRGDDLELTCEGLDEGLAQRLRNALLFHRARL